MLSASSEGELSAVVTSHVASGWQPEDAMVVGSGGSVYQKLVKREETGTDILAFNRIAGQTGPTVIDAVAHTVTLEVANGTSLTGVAFQATLSVGAASDKASPQNFVDGVANVFTITSESGDTQAWGVTINVAAL